MRILAILLVLLVSTPILSAFNEVTKATIEKGELRLQFSKPIKKGDIRTFTLKKPYRKVFDFAHCRLGNRAIGKGLHYEATRRLKVAQYRPNTVRVVVESDPYYCAAYQPILTPKHYHIPLPKLFGKTTKRDGTTTVTTTHLPAKRYNASKKSSTKGRTKKSPSSKAKLANVRAPKRRKSPLSYTKRLIVIDPGHGGHDAGAVGGGKREKDLVLQIAKRVEKELKRRGYTVYLTRHNDRYLKLLDRTHIADTRDAALFVSIHANSVPKRKRNRVYGIETFFLDNARDAKSRAVARRENAAVLKGVKSRLSKKVIVDSVLNGPKIRESNKLAIDVQSRMMANLKPHYKYIKDGGVRHAPFLVLIGASCPSILVEVGYISHPRERRRLFSPRYQQRLAKGIAEGIDNYLRKRMREFGF